MDFNSDGMIIFLPKYDAGLLVSTFEQERNDANNKRKKVVVIKNLKYLFHMDSNDKMMPIMCTHDVEMNKIDITYCI